MAKRKVLFLSIHDWANSGYKMCEAVNRHSKRYECHYFAIFNHPFGYHRGGRYIHEYTDTEQVQARKEIVDALLEAVETCDLIHYKEDVGMLKEIAGVSIPYQTKPTMITFCGSHFRAHDQDIYNQFKNIARKLTVTTPNLNGEGMDMDVLPFAVDEDKYRPIQKSPDCIIIGHCPSNPKSKGTDIISPVIEKVCATDNKRLFPFMFNKLPHYMLMEMKRPMHIYIDQIAHGAYGNSAVESMALGSAVMAYSAYGAEGVINTPDANTLEEQLMLLVSNPELLEMQQFIAHEWFKQYHSYRAVCSRVEQYYDEVLA
jgi:hypothetical protein